MLVKVTPYFLTVSAYSAVATSVSVPLGASFSSHEKNSHRATASFIWNLDKPWQLYNVDKFVALLYAM